MLEALRGLGYSTAGALADIIDNSLAVHSANIDLVFVWDKESSYAYVLDDGTGMTELELFAAMKLGERSPLVPRRPEDLGRFGMGLKTASLSQARCLSVATKKGGMISCLRWDLDEIAASEGDGWFLQEGLADQSQHLLQLLDDRDSGTLVLWEKMDRVVTCDFTEQNLLNLLDSVESHLSMVFHRYLSRAHPKLCLRLNGRRLNPWDPFLTAHSATWTSPLVQLTTESGRVEIECHVLPHKDKLDARQYQLAAGPHGWTAQQGFYVYRNERLLLDGSWLGLGQGRAWTKEEAHRLARIRVDIPNTADSEWKIDIRKSSARPPVSIRTQLSRLAEDTRERARRVFAHRGQPVRMGGKEVIQAWRAEHATGGMRYRVDQSHPAVQAVLDQAGTVRTQVLAMLRILEETLPVQRIWLDTVESKETPLTGFAGEATPEILEVLLVLYRNLLRKGFSENSAKQRLLQTEPFNNYPELVTALPVEDNGEV